MDTAARSRSCIEADDTLDVQERTPGDLGAPSLETTTRISNMDGVPPEEVRLETRKKVDFIHFPWMVIFCIHFFHLCV